MKKLLLASLVGAIILFMWNAVSWMALPTHFNSFKYTPAQDSLLGNMKAAGLETGVYRLPMVDNRNVSSSDASYKKAQAELQAECAGKDVAMVFYTQSVSMDMTSSFVMGYMYLFISVFCVCLILAAASSKIKTFGSRLWMVMLFALLFALQGPMSDFNWMQFPWHYTMPMLVDIFAGWGLCGLWLSWYLGRE
jgi:hypothetical protein